MKLLCFLVTICFILAVSPAFADEKPISRQEAPEEKTPTKATPHGENADLSGLIVTGAMKQIIGTFSTYGHPAVGDTFEIDLTNLPKEKIEFMRDSSKARSGNYPPYIPFSAPLNVERVDKRGKGDGTSIILLSSRGSSSILLIQVRAEEMGKGSNVRIYFYQETYGRIICMAEADGVLK
jgi:hypothetical protein